MSIATKSLGTKFNKAYSLIENMLYTVDKDLLIDLVNEYRMVVALSDTANHTMDKVNKCFNNTITKLKLNDGRLDPHNYSHNDKKLSEKYVKVLEYTRINLVSIFKDFPMVLMHDMISESRKLNMILGCTVHPLESLLKVMSDLTRHEAEQSVSA